MEIQDANQLQQALARTQRPDRDQHALLIADAVATRGECVRSRVGAVLVDFRGRLRGSGFNGVGPGESSCLDGSCPRGRMSYEQQPAGGSYENCKAIHAEENLLINSESRDQINGTVYLTRPPCEKCTRLLRIAGIAKAVYRTSGRQVETKVLTH